MTSKLAVLHRVCAGYEAAQFRELAATEGWQVRFFIGEDFPDSRVKNAKDLTGLDVVKLPTRFIRIRGRTLADHRGLRAALDAFEPDVLLCEGESNMLSNLKALAWRQRHHQVGMVHFTIGGMPGAERSWLRRAALRRLHTGFDFYVAFSSFGKRALVALGHPPERVFVAPFVCDTDAQLRAAADCRLTRAEARRRLGLPERFTALFVGNMEPQKRVDKLLQAAEQLDPERFNIVLVGTYGRETEYRRYAETHRMRHVFFRGFIDDDIALYYRASNTLVLPGRGGVVISEAMAHGLPPIVCQADGTERDLVAHGETGLQLEEGTPEDIRRAIERMASDPAQTEEWGARGRARIEEHFNAHHTALVTMRAVEAAFSWRRGDRRPQPEAR